MRFFITELPILPASSEAPITATAFGCMIRFIAVTMSSSLRAVARGLCVEVDDDAHVGGDRALLGREDRVEVELDDLREVADELRHADDDVGERVAVDRVAAAHAVQHLRRLDAVEHRQRVVLGRRREAEGDVLQHLDEHAAEAEGDELAEARVGDRADDDLRAALQHLLHLDAVDLGVGLVVLGVGEDRVVGRLAPRRRS